MVSLILDESMDTPEPKGNPTSQNQDEVVRLLRQAHEGDQEALALLLENYRNYLLLIANGEFDQRLRNKFGPSDVVQRSLISANANFHLFAGESERELKAWLRTILKNDLFKSQRNFNAHKRNARREVDMAGSPQLASELVDGQLTPSSKAVANENREALKQPFSKLTPQQQEVIRLRNFERKSFVEIGQQTSRSTDAARKFWARSVEALKLAMKQAEPELFDDSIVEGQP